MPENARYFRLAFVGVLINLSKNLKFILTATLVFAIFDSVDADIRLVSLAKRYCGKRYIQLPELQTLSDRSVRGTEAGWYLAFPA